MQIANITPPSELPERLNTQGWALMPPSELMPWLGATESDLSRIHDSWSRLPPDHHLKDGGRYRKRRHSCFTLDVGGEALTQVEHRPHWQPVSYNALHGGIERLFEPIEPSVCRHPVWRALLTQLGVSLAQNLSTPTWFIEAHQFRVDTEGGIGRPTPEGAHRDGVDFVAVLLLQRHEIKGGETRVFEADGPHGVRFTLREPWSVLMLDDVRVIHESTPIQPELPSGYGWRDTLVLTFRRNAFQGPTSI